MEIVTGKAGVPHVSSADDGRRIAGEVGTGSYVLQTGGRLAPSLVDANTIRFATGDMIVQGRHIGLTAPEDVKVASGTQGKKRTDYICVHYKRDVSGSNPTLVETVEWTVLQGTPGTDAAAPSVPAGSILNGDADVTVPICSVDFDGLATGEPKLLIGALTPIATIGNFVSLYETENWSVVRVGMTMYIRATKIISDISDGVACKYTIPEGLRPSHAWSAAMVTEYGGTDDSYRLVVLSDGTIKVHNMGGKMTTHNHFASLSYPIGM